MLKHLVGAGLLLLLAVPSAGAGEAVDGRPGPLRRIEVSSGSVAIEVRFDPVETEGKNPDTAPVDLPPGSQRVRVAIPGDASPKLSVDRDDWAPASGPVDSATVDARKTEAAPRVSTYWIGENRYAEILVPSASRPLSDGGSRLYRQGTTLRLSWESALPLRGAARDLPPTATF